MKELKLIRSSITDEEILGTLYLEGQEVCKTLELPYKDNANNISCIPAGSYTLSPYPSKKFGEVYIVENVPGRTGILIHKGNTTDDIRGCILVGLEYGRLDDKRAVLYSQAAMNKLKRLLGEESYKFVVLVG